MEMVAEKRDRHSTQLYLYYDKSPTSHIMVLVVTFLQYKDSKLHSARLLPSNTYVIDYL